MIFILFSVNGFIVIAFFSISSNIFQIKSYIFPGVKIESDLKKKCPICPALVIKLPRHMRSVHKMLPEEASRVNTKFGNKKSQGKTKRIRKRCPYKNCCAFVARMPHHLQNVHKLNRKSEKYKTILSNLRKAYPMYLSDDKE